MGQRGGEPKRCLPRAHRIRKRADFVRIQATGLRVTARYVTLLLASAKISRLGIVASRKLGSAVVRNRAKRLIREVFRNFPEFFPEQVDVVVLVRPGTSALGLADIATDIRSVAGLVRRRANELQGMRTDEGRGDLAAGGRWRTAGKKKEATRGRAASLKRQGRNEEANREEAADGAQVARKKEEAMGHEEGK